MKISKDQISTAVKTGKVIMGAKEVAALLLNGKAKLILLSANCPIRLREQMEYYSHLAATPCSFTEFDSLELGSICARPHSLSALAILDPGDSSLLENSQ